MVIAPEFLSIETPVISKLSAVAGVSSVTLIPYWVDG